MITFYSYWERNLVAKGNRLKYFPMARLGLFEWSHHVVYRFNTYLLYINIIIQTAVKTQL
jgi:hypothetical protein